MVILRYSRALAKYFSAKPLYLDEEKKKPNIRKVAELPWQYWKIAEWGKLYEVLSDIEFFDLSWQFSAFDAKRYWSSIERNSKLSMVKAYSEVFNDPDKYYKMFLKLGILFTDLGHLVQSIKIKEYLISYYRQKKDYANLQVSLGNLGITKLRLGDRDEAERLFNEQEILCRQCKINHDLATSLYNQGVIWQLRGQLEKAMKYYEESQRLAEQSGNESILGSSLDKQAIIFRDGDNISKAVELHKAAIEIFKKLGDLDGLQGCYGNLALAYFMQNNIDLGKELLKKQQVICIDIGNKQDLVNSYYNEALMYYNAFNNIPSALSLMELACNIAKDSNLQSLFKEIEPFYIHLQSVK
jgi:tetratricopeptide (TPR) repeat protein